MASLLRRAGRAARRAMGQDHVLHDGAVLPLPQDRYNGTPFRDDAFFLASAVEEATRLLAHPGLTDSTRILEIGGGPGRLPIGLLHVDAPLASFHGIDIDRRAMEWSTRKITRNAPAYRFTHIDVRNDRYNPDGPEMGPDFRLPFPSESFDIIYLHSVLTNLLEEDARIYAREFTRLLAPQGRVFLTLFVEEDVPDFTVNPTDYVMPISGPLHIVRWERGHLFEMFDEAGLLVDRYQHGTALGGQSELYLARQQ